MYLNGHYKTVLATDGRAIWWLKHRQHHCLQFLTGGWVNEQYQRMVKKQNQAWLGRHQLMEWSMGTTFSFHAVSIKQYNSYCYQPFRCTISHKSAGLVHQWTNNFKEEMSYLAISASPTFLINLKGLSNIEVSASSADNSPVYRNLISLGNLKIRSSTQTQWTV